VLKLRGKYFLQFPDAFFIPLIERPLLYFFALDQASPHHDIEVFTCGWLADLESLGDGQAANPILYKISVNLGRKPVNGPFQPLENLQTPVIG